MIDARSRLIVALDLPDRKTALDTMAGGSTDAPGWSRWGCSCSWRKGRIWSGRFVPWDRTSFST